ncbi:MAG TPA: hypothetical protein VIM11_10925 [Tepidisphaeraceae bacterium]
MNASKKGALGPVPHVYRPQRNAAPIISAPPLPAPPQWAMDWVGHATASSTSGCWIRRSERFTLLSACIADVEDMSGQNLELVAGEAYRLLLGALQDGPHPHLVRIWNFIPRILDSVGAGVDRYMCFNAGRHRAFVEFFEGEMSFDRSLPAASAVGHTGSDLVIHALATAQPGNAIANPRQLAPHRYSSRFGPRPPCFARATLLDSFNNSRALLIGGTASIRGEESVHVGQLGAQLAETKDNLIALLAAASGQAASCQLLNQLDQLRVYYPRAGDLPEIRRAIEKWFTHPNRVEWRLADLCRRDLLVEIEGRAVLPNSPVIAP